MSGGPNIAARLEGSSRALRVLVLLVPLVVAGQAETQEPIPLLVGQSSTKTVGAGQPVTYVLEAEAGETYLIEVEQLGLDFIVTIEGLDERPKLYDSPLRRDETELVVISPAEDGAHLIAVHSDEPTDARGTFVLEVIQRATDDPRYAAAWQAMSDGAAANAAGGRENAEQARDLYVGAAGLWETLGEKRLQAQALYSAGMLEYWQLEHWARPNIMPDDPSQDRYGAVEYADRAAGIYLELGELTLYADAILLRAYARLETAASFEQTEKDAVYERSLLSLQEALAIHEMLGNDYAMANVLNFMGIAHWYRADRDRGDYDAARQYYNDSVAVFSRLGEWRQELNGLQNIVVLDNSEGRSLQAIESFERILDRLPLGRDPSLRAAILGNLATAHFAFGNIEESLRLNSQAHDLSESIGDITIQGYALKNIGQTYFAIGDLPRATEFLRMAEAVATEANDHRTSANIESILGNIAFSEQDYELALERHRNSVDRESSREIRARRKLLVAKDLGALNRNSEAIDVAKEAYDETRSERTRADALLELAINQIKIGKPAEAIAQLDAASGIYQALNLVARQGDALHGYSLAAHARGDTEAAVDYGRMALDRIESLRERVAHPELRALNGATRRTYYDHQVMLLMALHAASGDEYSEYLAEALTTNERSRARMTIDLLNESIVDPSRGMEEDAASRIRALYEALAEKRQAQEQVLSRDDFTRLSFEMAEIENELDIIETENRRAQEHSLNVASSRPLSATEIQARLDSESVVLQYALGETQSYLWAVTTDSIRGFELPDRATIETLARAVHADVSLPPNVRNSREMQTKLAELSTYLLDPVIDLIGAKPRLLIAADGALQYVPFGILPVSSGQSAASHVVLIAQRDDREIISLASMSVLSAMSARPRREIPKNALAVFADPVMEATDSRFGDVVAADREPQAAQISATRAMNGPTLSRIPYTAFEADAIASIEPTSANLLAIGFDADLDTVLRGDLGKYRYIHFATHGIVDSEHPALSALALSQYDQHGHRVAGFLRLHDIYRLNLNADVVVLSACETALGRQIRGEGLIGLTQGFIYAGARSLVASLWQVPDRGTANLMTKFYRYLLGDGASPAQSLAAAQRSMLTERGSTDPYYWGAFVIQGALRASGGDDRSVP